MNTLKNRVFLIGRLGQNPETKTIESGKKVTRFTLATDDSYKNSEGQKIRKPHGTISLPGTASPR